MYRPWVGRSFGVELEMTGRTNARQSVSERMLREALQMAVPRERINRQPAGYYHSDGSTWDVKTDSSCGWEVASPAFTLDAQGHNAELQAVCSRFSALDIVVDRSCGTHEHVDCSDYQWDDMKRLLLLWARYEPFFFELMPQARRDNVYCEPLTRNTWHGSPNDTWRLIHAAGRATTRAAFEQAARQVQRRCALNVAGFWRHGRVEVRLHSGTINYTKIRMWSMLMGAVFQRVKLGEMPEIKAGDGNPPTAGLSTEYICKQLGLLPSRFVPEVPQESLDLAAWLNTRRLQFTPNAPRPAGAPPRPTPATSPASTSGRGGSQRPSPIGDSARDRAWQRATESVRANQRGRIDANATGCTAAGLNCPHPRVGSRTLCAWHYDDWANHRPWTPLDQIRLEPEGVRFPFELWARVMGETRCSAGGMNCPNPRYGSSLLCREHYLQWENRGSVTSRWRPVPVEFGAGHRVRVREDVEPRWSGQSGFVGRTGRHPDPNNTDRVVWVYLDNAPEEVFFFPDELEMLPPVRRAQLNDRVRIVSYPDRIYRGVTGTVTASGHSYTEVRADGEFPQHIDVDPQGIVPWDGAEYPSTYTREAVR